MVVAAVAIFAVIGALLLFANQGPAPQRREVHLRVVGGTMTPDRLQAYQGDTLAITIEMDRTEEIHLHGYDKHFVGGPGQPAVVTFSADLTGSFELEIEDSSTAVGTLQVQPRGLGLFGLGRPAEQRATAGEEDEHAGAISKATATSSYNMTLQLGPLTPMYTPDQVAAKHPKAGEVMFGGEMLMPPGMVGMDDMAGMAAPPDWRHLEVHVIDKRTGDAIKGLTPMITITAVATGQSRTLPVVTMQGVSEGSKDFHYGNNVELPKGAYVITLAVGDQVGKFDVSL